MLPLRCSGPSGRTTADPVLLGSGRVSPLVSPCPKAPRAMAIIAKCVDAQPGHVAGRLLPNGSGVSYALDQPKATSDAGKKLGRSRCGRIVGVDTLTLFGLLAVSAMLVC